MNKYPVRTNYEKYGATAYFNQQKQPIGMWYPSKQIFVKPDDTDWNHIKALFRSSIMTLCTAREHLSYIHFISSNSFLLSVTQTCSEVHPIRRFLKPHYAQSPGANRLGFQLLSPYFGILACLGCFTNFNDVMYDCLASYKYELFPDLIRVTGFLELLKMKFVTICILLI